MNTGQWKSTKTSCDDQSQSPPLRGAATPALRHPLPAHPAAKHICEIQNLPPTGPLTTDPSHFTTLPANDLWIAMNWVHSASIQRTQSRNSPALELSFGDCPGSSDASCWMQHRTVTQHEFFIRVATLRRMPRTAIPPPGGCTRM